MEPPSPATWILGSACFYLPASAMAAGWVWWWYGLSELGVRMVGPSPLLALSLGLALGVGIALASQAAARLAWVARMRDGLAEIFGPIGWPTALALAALSALGEELVFRVAMQPSLGLVWTSILFGSVHVPLERRLWVWPIFATAMGLLFGVLYQELGALAPIGCHFAINALNLKAVGDAADRSGSDATAH